MLVFFYIKKISKLVINIKNKMGTIISIIRISLILYQLWMSFLDSSFSSLIHYIYIYIYICACVCFRNKLISNRFNPAEDHNHDYQPQLRILVPSVSVFYGLCALIFFTLS